MNTTVITQNNPINVRIEQADRPDLNVTVGRNTTITVQVSGVRGLRGLNAVSHSGWAVYFNKAGPQLVQGNTETTLIIDGAAKIETQKPSDIESFFTANKITGRNGDGLSLTIEFSFTPDDGNTSEMSVWIDIGGNIGWLGYKTFQLTRGAMLPHPITFEIASGYTLDTWEANGGLIKFKADGSGTIKGPLKSENEFSDPRIVTTRTHKAIA